MPDKTLASLTAATPATGGLLYGTQGGADRKFTLTAAGAKVLEAGSGMHTGVAFVDTAIGNNGTAEVGDPAKTYATIQAAYNAGAKVFSLIGSVGNLVVSGSTETLTLIGAGIGKSMIGDLTTAGSEPSNTLTLIGNGRHLISVNNIDMRGGDEGVNGAPGGENETGGNGTDGSSALGLDVRSVHISLGISANGRRGGNGGTGGYIGDDGLNGGKGGNGGSGGTIRVEDCYISASGIVAKGAMGGNGGDGGASGAFGGGGNGGDGGSNGNAGVVELVNTSMAGGNVDFALASSSNGGTGGTGPVGGSNGSIGATGALGSFSARWSEYQDVIGSDSGILIANIINGIFSA